MVLSPAKRQKKHALSEGEDDGGTANTKTRSKRPKDGNVSLPTRSRKETSEGKHGAEDKSSKIQKNVGPKGSTTRARPISAFFGPAIEVSSQSERSRVNKQDHQESQSTANRLEESADAIEEISDDDNDVHRSRTSSAVDRAPNASAPTRSERSHIDGQKFKLNERHHRDGSRNTKVHENAQRPWVDKYPPLDLSELAVHQKKISNVRDWLQNALFGHNSRKVLVLKGPAGAGKTTTLSLLAQSMNVELLDWKNPVGSDTLAEGQMSMSAQFEDFLGRNHKIRGLRIQADSGPTSISPLQGPETTDSSEKKRAIVIEEFPTSLNSASSVLQSFRLAISQYLAACSASVGPSMQGGENALSIAPLILIITESRPQSNGSTNENFTVNRILGLDIINHPSLTIMEFNPVAITFVRKALDLLIQKEARDSGRRRVPGPAVLRALCEVGDVRSAIGSLEFLCLKGEHEEWSGRVAAFTKKGANTSSDMTSRERDLLEMVSTRESSLGLFHAIGKVMYNKRVNDNTVDDSEQVSNRKVGKTPEVSIDKLMDECDTDVETFLAALHENYVLSCNGDTFSDSVDNCLTALSDGDVTGHPGGGRRSGVYASTAGSTDSLKHDEIVFHCVTRGILFALPYPVKRASLPIDPNDPRRSSRTSGHKMYYPNAMRLPRQIEEIEELVEQWQRRFSQTPNQPSQSSLEAGSGDTDLQPLLRINLASTKAELLLERLPYAYKIESQRPQIDPSALQDLENITQFRRPLLLDEDLSGAEDEGFDENDTSTAMPSEGVPAPDKASRTHVNESLEGVIRTDDTPSATNLYLADDDIEDD